MKRNPNTTTVSFSLDSDSAKKLYTFCEQADISVSRWIRRLVIKKLDEITLMGEDYE